MPGPSNMSAGHSRAEVHVTTLDAMIAAHGLPRYIKIDVEGYEAEVLSGLSQPVDLVSFEYLPGLPQASAAVLARLAELGHLLNSTWCGARMRALTGPDWRDLAQLRAWLARQAPDSGSGDIYAAADQRRNVLARAQNFAREGWNTPGAAVSTVPVCSGGRPGSSPATTAAPPVAAEPAPQQCPKAASGAPRTRPAARRRHRPDPAPPPPSGAGPRNAGASRAISAA